MGFVPHCRDDDGLDDAVGAGLDFFVTLLALERRAVRTCILWNRK